MDVQPGVCWTLSETLETVFLAKRVIYNYLVILILQGGIKEKISDIICFFLLLNINLSWLCAIECPLPTFMFREIKQKRLTALIQSIELMFSSDT